MENLVIVENCGELWRIVENCGEIFFSFKKIVGKYGEAQRILLVKNSFIHSNFNLKIVEYLVGMENCGELWRIGKPQLDILWSRDSLGFNRQCGNTIITLYRIPINRLS